MSTNASDPVQGAHVQAAAARIGPHVHRTPVVRCRSINDIVGFDCHFKCESFQRGGSFKLRGALNAVFNLPAPTRALGVFTHSSGNFAQGLALAARSAGVHATIVMPSSAPAVKQAAVRGYGAHVVLCEPTLASRIATVGALAQEAKGTVISPSDHPDVIAGQGTCGLELLDQVSGLDAVVVPLGGGGLLGGIAVAVKAFAPEVTVIGAEPAGADDAWRSRQAGRRLGHPPEGPRTICDGLRTELGEYTWPLVRDRVDHVVRVEDSTTKQAMRLLYERAKLVVEPSAAIALGVLMTDGHALPPSARVGVVLSGGNLDLDSLPALLSRAS
ncbi:MAG TPA: serine dehydratase [Deltaproteobacteria bacterium]|nr:serine dehydratase [Deltaproteobacteria bacterium]